MKLILVAVLALAHSAHAILTVNEISGDANTLHADFAMSWAAAGGGEIAAGSWEGGAWSFAYGIGLPSNGYGEATSRFYFRQTWADGWNPGPVSKTFSFHLFGGNDPVDHPFAPDYNFSAQPVAFDYADTGLVYHLDAAIFGHFTTNTNTSGDAHFVFDLERTPQPVSQNDFTKAIAAESLPVPDSGSTVILFGLAAGLLAFHKAR